MPFKKGASGNPKGRKQGTPNAVTQDLRTRIRNLLESRFEQVETDFEALDPKERLIYWLKMAEFVLPKLQRSETVIDFSKLTDEEINMLFDRANAKDEK